jgi:hypothetical protein
MSKSSTISVAPVRLPDDIDIVRRLFVEYIDSLGIDLFFQDVDAELADLVLHPIFRTQDGVRQPRGL